MYKTSLPYLFFIIAVFFASTSQAQNNRLESSGNVGIGTTTPVVKLRRVDTLFDRSAEAVEIVAGTDIPFTKTK